MNDSMLSSPVYEIPLGDNDLVTIGRTTVMWAQIDFQLSLILESLHGLDAEQFGMFFGGRTVGYRASAARRVANRARFNAANAVIEMCDAIALCLVDRNLMTHGIWGWRWCEQQLRWQACASDRHKNTAFDAAELRNLHEYVHQASIKADAAFHLMRNEDVPKRVNRSVFFAPFPPERAPGGLPPRFAR